MKDSIKPLVVFGLVIIVLVPYLVVFADTGTQQEVPDVIVGNVAELDKSKVSLITIEQALELAYTLRNITYDLFQWEISYNVTAARVQLEIGDRFLERAINMSDTAPKRAVVFALVAMIHYGHASPLANIVLGRVIDSNLGENGEITVQTVNAVLNTASELKTLLVSAIEYAKSKNYNTTLAETILVKADERYVEAQRVLAEGNISLAFRLAVSAYRAYVRAYSSLILSVRSQFMTKIGIKPGELVVPREKALRKIIENLPQPVREMIRNRIEVRNMQQVVSEIKKQALEIREQIQIRERENLKAMIRNIIQRFKEKHGVNINQTDIERRIDQYYQRGIRGIDLAKKIIGELESIVNQKLTGIISSTQPRR